MKTKRMISTLAVSVMLLSVPVFGQGGPNITMDNNPVSFKTPPIIKNNKTLISLRDISYQFGIKVENDGTVITCKLGNRYITFNVNEKIAKANGKNIRLDGVILHQNGDTFVPMRDLFENLGYGVYWNSPSKSIDITMKANQGEDGVASFKVPHAKYIAHAGGEIDGLALTNSKEAIENSYRNGHSLIELDMNWSTDDELLLLHDWGNFSRFINVAETKKYSVEEFKSFKINGNLTPMTLDELANWLDNNQGVYIVTDIKYNNLKALRLIKDRYPEIQNRFVPQIYSFQEYDEVDKMGYENIIMTTYNSNYSDDQILEFAKNHKLFAVTLPASRARTNLPTSLLKENVFTYTHTINTEESVRDFKKYNIKGFYSDVLNP